jgi:hypothetical protein
MHPGAATEFEDIHGVRSVFAYQRSNETTLAGVVLVLVQQVIVPGI